MAGTKTLKQATGSHGENLAADYLKKQGYRLLARNWRKGSYELDIVCADKTTLIFVEVKTRGEGSLESPEEALTSAKQKSLLRAAREYLQDTKAWDSPCRFDLVSVNLDPGEKGCRLEHIENVIEFNGTTGNAGGGCRSGQTGRTGGGERGSPLDSGYSPWQPW